MSHYKPYPAYKDSNVEWIGDVPEGWDVARIKHVSSLRTERCTDVPDGWRYIGLEDVESETGKYRPTEGNSRQSEDSTVGVFRSGDVLYGKLRPYLRKAIVSNSNGVCSTEFLVMQPTSIVAPWLHRWLLTTEVTQQIEAGCEGSKMPRADWEHVGSIHVPFPNSSSEQAEIILVLDRETTRIDTLITKKTRFIELLKEKRSALITHAVTKGLDPNVKMKDSGVEWIGEVSEGWDVFRIKRTSLLSNERRNDAPEGQIYIGLEDVEPVSGKYSPTAGTSRQSEDSTVGTFQEGDVLYGKLRPYLRKAIIATGDGVCSTEFLVIKPVKVLSSWIHKWLLTTDVTQQIEAGCDGAKMPRADWEHVGSIPVPAPSLDEQRLIITALEKIISRIDLLCEKTQHSIDLLKERRAAFITAAVTGQIDLRESA